MHDLILSTLTRTLMFSKDPDPGQIEQTGQFLSRQTGRLPDHIRLLIRIATFIFGWGSILLYGRSFVNLSPLQRSTYAALWATSPFPPFRDYIRLIQSLTTLSTQERAS